MTTNTQNEGKEARHVHFQEGGIDRKISKEHIDYPKTPSCKETRVRFEGDDIARKAGKEHVDNPKTKLKARRTIPNKQDQEPFEHPAKVKVSKEDFLLHLKIFCSAILFFIGSVAYSNLYPKTSVSEVEKDNVLDEVRKIQVEELKLIEPELPTNSIFQIPIIDLDGDGDDSNDNNSHVEVGDNVIIDVRKDVGSNGDTNRGECSIFLTESSISAAGTNFGLFTTKPVLEGDVLFPSGKTLNIEGMEVSVQAILIKQHPNFSNVKWTKQSGIVAKKDIKAGQELFIDFEDFNDSAAFANIYHSILHKNDPLKEEYDMVDSILDDVIAAIPHKVVYPPKRKNYKMRTKRGDGKLVPTVNAGRILLVVKNAMLKYNERLARLIPETTIKARSIMEAKGSAKFISNNRSVQWITDNGVCFGSLSSESSCSVTQAMMAEERSTGAFTTHSVSEGDIIESVPLFAMRRDESPSHSNCINASVDDVVLCPLSSISSARKGKQCKSGVDECPTNMINAKYQWSGLNVGNKAIGDMTAEGLLENPLTGLTLDIVALRDISHNTEVFIDFSN